MRVYCLFLLGLMLADLSLWRIGDLRLRRAATPKIFRLLLCACLFILITYPAYLLLHAFFRSFQNPFTMSWVVAAFVWHLVVLPLAILIFTFSKTPPAIARLFRRSGRFHPQLPENSLVNEQPVRMTRRQALATGIVAVPPLVTGALTWRAVVQLNEFRIRRVDLRVPSLPADLEGLTIAHVTDLHIGPFLPRGKLERVADATNALDADLIAFTGDLNDQATRNTRLAIDFLKRLSPRHGLAMIEGNHDVMNDVERFEVPILSAGFPLLLDEALTFRIPGRPTPVQMLGLTWGDPFRGKQLNRDGLDADKLFRIQSKEAMQSSLARVLARRDPLAFPVLLAHHPHAFDLAADANLPLILSGHTHGGQVMLTEHIGAGPLRFRYWSGLYRKQQSQLFVSNGVGAWFPLRLNAPAEIVHITLRKGDA